MTLGLLAGCPSKEAPTIKSFSADPTTVAEGESTTLGWEVLDADDIEIRAQPGGVVVSTTEARGMKLTSALAETTLFTIIASNEQGTKAGAVSVMVAKESTPIVHLFTATPAEVRPGGAVVLAWETSNATSVDIAPGVVSAAAADGIFTVNPQATTMYQLTAVSPQGTATAEVVVTVVADAPIILDFVAAPDPIALGASTTLSWETNAADTLRILEGATELLTTTDNLADLEVTPTATVARYTLEAINAGGTTTEEVEVHAHPPATIVAFNANPIVFGAQADITVSWRVSNTAELRLFANGAPIAGFDVNPAARDDDDELIMTVTASTTFRLEVASAGGEDSAEIVVSNRLNELEPNDDSGTATPIVGDGTVLHGSIDPVDQDWYLVTVPPGGNLTASLSDEGGGCTLDARIEIFDFTGVQSIAEDQRTCATVSPFDDPGLLDMIGGPYFIRVTATTIGPYVLDVLAESPRCSNMLIELGEQCDDGNLTPGDGCDAACLSEQLSIGTLPTLSPLSATDSIAGPEHDLFQLTVTATCYLHAETFAPNQAAGCAANNDTILALLDSNQIELGRNDDGGIGTCSLIDVVETFALLAPGTYYLDVSTFKGSPVPAYELVVSSAPYMACGNRVLEPGEACDDGNAVDGDGCSAVCVFEGLVVSETEPNDLITDSNSTGIGGIDLGVMQGNASTTISDLDYWSFIVPVNSQLFLTAITHTTLGDPFACDPSLDTFLELRDSSDNVIDFDDDGGAGQCSLLQTVVSAGASPEVYHLVVGIPALGSQTYFLTVSLR